MNIYIYKVEGISKVKTNNLLQTNLKITDNEINILMLYAARVTRA